MAICEYFQMTATSTGRDMPRCVILIRSLVAAVLELGIAQKFSLDVPVFVAACHQQTHGPSACCWNESNIHQAKAVRGVRIYQRTHSTKHLVQTRVCFQRSRHTSTFTVSPFAPTFNEETTVLEPPHPPPVGPCRARMLGQTRSMELISTCSFTHRELRCIVEQCRFLSQPSC